MRPIFISHRREDAEGQAGRPFDELVRAFGRDAVFLDVAAFEPGRDFRKVIDRHGVSCVVLLAVIGKGWIDARDARGKRWLDDGADFVRLETASALRRDIPVVPVLVHGAEMPREGDLPEGLKALTWRHGVQVTHARRDSDVKILIAALSTYVRASALAAEAPAPAASKALAAASWAPAPAPSGGASRAPLCVGGVVLAAAAVAAMGGASAARARLRQWNRSGAASSGTGPTPTARSSPCVTTRALWKRSATPSASGTFCEASGAKITCSHASRSRARR